MRRPIFGNGIPRNIRNADGDVTVLDTTALDPKQTYALTLFLWWYQPDPAGALTQPTVVMKVATNGGSQKLIGQISRLYLETIWDGNASPGVGADIRPLKILSKYMIRGNQQVIVKNTEPLNTSCFMWGYFEQAGEDVTPALFRGLQPTAPVAPFSYPPVVYDIPAGPYAPPFSQAQPLHQLNPAYIDLVTLDAWTFVLGYGGGGSDVVTFITLPGPVALPLPTTITGVPFRIFDGIPMRAPNSNDTLIQLAAVTPLSLMTGGAYGSFHRI